MFNVKQKILTCDFSNFTLGANIVVVEGSVVVLKTAATSSREAIEAVYNLCEIHDISNVFIRPLAPVDTKKVLGEFTKAGQTKFSKTFDKIHFHVI